MYNKINNLYYKSRNGDIKAKEELLKSFKPLIISTMKKYYYTQSEFEDLIQEGYEVILKGIDDFDEKKGVKFPGYIKTILKYHYLKKLNNKKEKISLDMPIGEDNLTLLDILKDDVDIEEDTIKKSTIQNMYKNISKLTDNQRRIIVAFYLEGYSIKEISKSLGVAYRTVVNTKKYALEKLKENI